MSTQGNHQGFPSMALAGPGHILVANGDISADGGFLYGINFNHSTDYGDTWSVLPDPQVRNQKVQLFNGTTYSLSANNWTQALGDPGPGVTGMCVTNAGTWLIAGSLKSGSPTTYARPCVLRSTDQGAHWLVSAAAPSPWSAGYPGNYDILATPINAAGDGTPTGNSNGPIVQVKSGIHAGRLIITMYGFANPGDTYTSSATIYSDDDGKNWSSGVIMANGQTLGYSVQEPCMCNLDDGRLLVMNRGVSFKTVQWSSDGGVTFTAPIIIPGFNQGRANVFQCSFSTVGNAWGDVIAFHRPIDFWRILSFTISHDRGLTWSEPAIIARADFDWQKLGVDPADIGGPIQGGRSAYADVVEIISGVFGVAWGMEFTARTDQYHDYSNSHSLVAFNRIIPQS